MALDAILRIKEPCLDLIASHVLRRENLFVIGESNRVYLREYACVLVILFNVASGIVVYRERSRAVDLILVPRIFPDHHQTI